MASGEWGEASGVVRRASVLECGAAPLGTALVFSSHRHSTVYASDKWQVTSDKWQVTSGKWRVGRGEWRGEARQRPGVRCPPARHRSGIFEPPSFNSLPHRTSPVSCIAIQTAQQNPKPEIRNKPKSQRTKTQNRPPLNRAHQRTAASHSASASWFWISVLRILDLFRISSFGFRI